MRRHSRLDFQKRVVDIENVGNYPLGEVATTVIPHLTLLGLKHALLAAKDVNDAYIGLCNGVFPKVRKPVAKTDPWHEAMALACAEQQATLEAGPKAKASVIAQAAAGYLDDMRTHVASLPKETLKAMKGHPAVIQHHRKITGAGQDQTSLLAIAGVMPVLPFNLPASVEMEVV